MGIPIDWSFVTESKIWSGEEAEEAEEAREAEAGCRRNELKLNKQISEEI